MTITTEYGKQNIFATEPAIEVMDNHNHEGDPMHIAEELNGRLAMMGFVAALGAYITTGQLIPNIW